MKNADHSDRANRTLVSTSATLLSLILLLTPLCATSLAVAGLKAQSAEPSKEKVQKVALMFTRASSWKAGNIKYFTPEPDKELKNSDAQIAGMIKGKIKEKSSGPNNKLDIAQVGSLEDAKKHGIEVVFAVDYREESGEFHQGEPMEGTTTDITCSFKRADQSGIATNWDNLNIAIKGKELPAFKPLPKLEQKSEGGLSVRFVPAPWLAEVLIRNMAFTAFADAIPVLAIKN